MPPKTKTEKIPDAPAEDAPTPAEAAAADAADADLKVVFRDLTFTVPRARTRSLHFQMALSTLNYAAIMTETLDPQQQFQILQVVDRGEDVFDAAAEYLGALSKAGGWGNSPSSG
jgi:hypothetical protein